MVEAGQGFLALINLLFGWMPVGLQVLCGGVIAIFITVLSLKIVKLIMDIIPFV